MQVHTIAALTPAEPTCADTQQDIVSLPNIQEVIAGFSCQEVNVATSVALSNSLVEVFPNPAVDYVCVKLNDNFASANMTVFSSNGSVQYHTDQLESFSRIETINWPPGLFLLKVEGMGFHAEIRLIVQ